MNVDQKESFFAKVRDLSTKGLGVVDHPSGQVFFVPGVWPGDEGVFSPEKVEKRYGFAKLIRLVKKSPERVETIPCGHHGFAIGDCGGCPWLMIDYPAQLQTKQHMLAHRWQRAKIPIADSHLQPIWSSPQAIGYRNRAQLKTDGNSVGFVSAQSKIIAAIDDCVMLTEKNRLILQRIRQSLPRNDWQPKNSGFLWNFIELDETVDYKDLILNKRLPFRQANDAQNLRMLQWLRSNIVNGKNLPAPCIELFCGSGNFTQVLSEVWQAPILATDVSANAIAALTEKKLPNVQTLAEDLFAVKGVRKLKKAGLHAKAKTCVLDPPREGFPLLDLFLEVFSSIEDVFYVSCNMETFCRDIHKAVKKFPNRFHSIEIQPVDQFPNTPHVELLAHMRS